MKVYTQFNLPILNDTDIKNALIILDSVDVNITETISKMQLNDQIVLLMSIKQIFETWSNEEFKNFKIRNNYNNIFDGFCFDSFKFFAFELHKDYTTNDTNSKWSDRVAQLNPNIIKNNFKYIFNFIMENTKFE